MVKVAEKQDINILVNMAVQLYENSTKKELQEEFCEDILNDNVKFFLKYENYIPVGFAQVSLRYDYVEGTISSPVGYLEGIFVQKNYRLKGYAKELLKECELWAKSKGAIEFASDCELNNIDSFRFHKALNFDEANRIICFTKRL